MKDDSQSAPPYAEIGVVEMVPPLERGGPADCHGPKPDVANARSSAEHQFDTHGSAEGPRRFANSAEIARLRRQKLAAVSFRSRPVTTNEAGQMDFLPGAVKVEFGIPDAPPVAANDYAGEIVELIRANPGKRFLDVGAGLRHTYYSNVLTAEIWPSASTDVICVGEDLPFSDAQFDFVICLAVLEHTKRPWLAAEEIIRVTKTGGLIRIDWPFLQPVHGYPHHYFNATPRGHVSLFERHCAIEACDVRIWQHPIFALTWMLNEWRGGLPEHLRSSFDDIRVGELLGMAEDHVGKPFCRELSNAGQEIIAAGTTMIARKLS